MVAVTSPKARLAASGIRICACRLFSSSSGSRPATVVMEVSRMGRKRARPACLAASRVACHAAQALLADEGHQQDAVVDDDAEQRGHADDAGHGQVQPQGHVSEDDADERGGDHQHQGDRRQIAAELQCQQHVDADQAEQDVAAEGLTGLGGFPALSKTSLYSVGAHRPSSLIDTASKGATDTGAAPAKRPISRQAPPSKA